MDSEIKPTDSWGEVFKKSFRAKQEEAKQRRAKGLGSIEIPFSYYKFVRKMCFDRCIRDMDNKVTDLQEESCMRECATNLIDVAKNFKVNAKSFTIE